jgi:rod shape-determining protein MreD
MGVKYIATIVLFVIALVLQLSFFAHFLIAGAGLNLVFMLFFNAIFFEKQHNATLMSWQVFSLAVIAGALLDIFYGTYIGVSVLAFIMIALFLKSARQFLMEGNDQYPFPSFLILFLICFTGYSIIIAFSENSFRLHGFVVFSVGFLITVVYNAAIASLVFLAYKKIAKKTMRHELQS